MRRRDFLVIAGSVGVLPAIAAAQPVAMRTIGFVNGFSPATHPQYLEAFRGGLAEKGWVEGKNVSIDYRWAESHPERLEELAAAIAQKKVDLIVASGGDDATLASKAAAPPSMPIIGTLGGDPIREGLVESLNHPGGNVTVISLLALGLTAKRVEILRQILPREASVAFLDDISAGGNPELRRQEVEAAAQKLSTTVAIVDARSLAQIDEAYPRLETQGVRGLVISSNPFFETEVVRNRILALSATHKIATIFIALEDVEAGSVLAYGTDFVEIYRDLGRYAGRVLSGEKPADLPVQQPTRFQLGINLKTAKTLGISIPQSLLVQADQVIE